MAFTTNPNQANPQIIISWKAPLRPYKKRNRLIIRFYLALTTLVSLIILFFGDLVLIIPVWALLFLFYVLTVTPPPEVENRVTQFGVETAGITVRWEMLSHFYFRRRFDFWVLTLVGHPPFFYHVYLVVTNNQLKKTLIDILTNFLIYLEKPPRSFSDRIIDWFSALLPEDQSQEKTSVVPPTVPAADEKPATTFP